jgi:NADH pyrophosphatase NudC (nudix superfamily)
MLNDFYNWIIMIGLFVIAFILAFAIFERKKKMGYWVKLGNREDAYTCNLCNQAVIERTQFCPGCGHPMKVGIKRRNRHA